MMLKNKTIAMTGGASGIGRATVLALAAEGARVLLCDINEEGAADTIKMAKGGPVEFVKVDLSDLASAEACGKEVLKRTGNKVDILVNGAGWDIGTPFKDQTNEFMDKVLAINLAGPVRLTHTIFKSMAENGSGKIISVASDAGRVGSSGEVVYSAAKAGIIGLTKAWPAKAPATRSPSIAFAPARPIRRCSTPTPKSSKPPCSAPFRSGGWPSPRTSPAPSCILRARPATTSPARS